MAGVLSAQSTSGLNLYLHIRSGALIWNGSSFVSYNSANWSTYSIALTEQTGSGFYTVAFPSGIAAGKYTFSLYVGATPALGDTPYGSDHIFWDGTSEVDQQTFTSGQIASIATSVVNAFEIPIGSSPTSGSINERIKAIDDKLPSGNISGFDYTLNNVNLASNQTGVTIGTVNSLGATARTQVNDELLDVLATDIQTELSSIPAATPTLKQAIMLLYMMARNKRTASTSVEQIYNNAGTAIATASVSDSGTVFTKEQFS